MGMASWVEKDIRVLETFIQDHCETKHMTREKEKDKLCPECKDTRDYAIHKREVYLLDPKQTCKNCDVI